ncbi:uncharacterized protein N7529_012166 [Penicillium soppii]|uniref:uncharacterized protein n=1 Tax=Penicillium soppii TaxID=69789 RepID=UPI0025473857|nr:uncharacterized protein N7529_012166 [Penicillium soppii]KAJ5852781.1 hypothetical protein N7529_012166 [Penicillium soppii]
MTSTQGMSFGDTIQYSARGVMGCTRLQTGAPPEEMVPEVERSLWSRPNVVSGLFTMMICVLQCLAGRYTELKLWNFTQKIETVIGRPAFILHQCPIIVHSSDLPTNWEISAAHPVRNGVSVFRTLSGNLEDRVTT